MFVDDFKGNFFILPITGDQRKGHLFVEHKLDYGIWLGVLLEPDLCFVHFNEPLVETFLVAILCFRVFFGTLFLLALSLFIVQLVDLGGVWSNSLKGALIVGVVVVRRNHWVAALLAVSFVGQTR